VEGGFQVEVPGEMKHHIQQMDTEIGIVDYHTYYFGSKNDSSGNYMFVVSYYESEALTIPEDSIELLDAFFDATVGEATEALGGELLILDDAKYKHKHPGKFWRIHYNDGSSVMKTFVYLVGNRFYSIQAAVDAKYSLSDDIDHFLYSFKLTDL